MWHLRLAASRLTKVSFQINFKKHASCFGQSSSLGLLISADPAPITTRLMSSEAKRLRTDNMKIGTHNGTFHCDEVLACFMLRLLPQYKDAEIIRTRDPALLAQCDVVVDVGGEFDPKKHRYDHHQRSFTDTFHSLCPEKPWETKLSSAGLVYVHFGRQVLAQLTQMKVWI